MITTKGTTKTMKKATKFKETITRKGTTKTKKKMIAMEGDDQRGEEGNKIQGGQSRSGKR
jgi:hypothetical protein